MKIKETGTVSIAKELAPLLLERKLKVDDNVTICRGFMFNGPVGLSTNVMVYACAIDAYSYVSHNTTICNAKIGRFCSIAHGSDIGAPLRINHNVITSAALDSTSPFNFYVRSNKRQPLSLCLPPFEYYSQTIIGNDVWLGAYVRIPQGVTIGHGAVVAANTVVTGDVPPYAVVGNGPKGMQIIKMRFSDEIIADLLDSQWWQYDIPALVEQDLLPEETDISAILELIKQAKARKSVKPVKAYKSNKAQGAKGTKAAAATKSAAAATSVPQDSTFEALDMAAAPATQAAKSIQDAPPLPLELPLLKDNWYYLTMEGEDKAHLYPVTKHFVPQQVLPIVLNKHTYNQQYQAMMAQNRYEKMQPQRRTYHLSAKNQSLLPQMI